MSRFKVGDQVICINGYVSGGKRLVTGKEYTVMGIYKYKCGIVSIYVGLCNEWGTMCQYCGFGIC